LTWIPPEQGFRILFTGHPPLPLYKILHLAMIILIPA
jgi:hypothetical protein